MVLQEKGITQSTPQFHTPGLPPQASKRGDQQNSDKITRGRSESMMLNRGLSAEGDLPSPGEVEQEESL